jgi:hypothetical protein
LKRLQHKSRSTRLMELLDAPPADESSDECSDEVLEAPQSSVSTTRARPKGKHDGY